MHKHRLLAALLVAACAPKSESLSSEASTSIADGSSTSVADGSSTSTVTDMTAPVSSGASSSTGMSSSMTGDPSGGCVVTFDEEVCLPHSGGSTSEASTGGGTTIGGTGETAGETTDAGETTAAEDLCAGVTLEPPGGDESGDCPQPTITGPVTKDSECCFTLRYENIPCGCSV